MVFSPKGVLPSLNAAVLALSESNPPRHNNHRYPKGDKSDNCKVDPQNRSNNIKECAEIRRYLEFSCHVAIKGIQIEDKNHKDGLLLHSHRPIRLQTDRQPPKQGISETT